MPCSFPCPTRSATGEEAFRTQHRLKASGSVDQPLAVAAWPKHVRQAPPRRCQRSVYSRASWPPGHPSVSTIRAGRQSLSAGEKPSGALGRPLSARDDGRQGDGSDTRARHQDGRLDQGVRTRDRARNRSPDGGRRATPRRESRRSNFMGAQTHWRRTRMARHNPPSACGGRVEERNALGDIRCSAARDMTFDPPPYDFHHLTSAHDSSNNVNVPIRGGYPSIGHEAIAPELVHIAARDSCAVEWAPGGGKIDPPLLSRESEGGARKPFEKPPPSPRGSPLEGEKPLGPFVAKDRIPRRNSLQRPASPNGSPR
jgi:hypothetical protein